MIALANARTAENRFTATVAAGETRPPEGENQAPREQGGSEDRGEEE